MIVSDKFSPQQVVSDIATNFVLRGTHYVYSSDTFASVVFSNMVSMLLWTDVHATQQFISLMSDYESYGVSSALRGTFIVRSPVSLHKTIVDISWLSFTYTGTHYVYTPTS